MEDFDFEKTERERREKENYIKATQKQRQRTSKVLFICFLIMGIIYISLGTILFTVLQEENDSLIVGIVIFCIGIIFIILSLLAKFIVTKSASYEKYKKTVDKYGYGYGNSNNAGIEVYNLKEENKELRERVESLERKIRDLEDK